MTAITGMPEVTPNGVLPSLNNTDSRCKNIQKKSVSSCTASFYVELSDEAASGMEFQKISELQDSKLFNQSNQTKLSVSNFTKTLLEYLENQDGLISNSSYSSIGGLTNFGLGANWSTTETTNDGKQVTVSSSPDGANIEILLTDGNKIAIDGVTSDVRFSTQEDGNIVMVTNSKTITFDAQGNKISEGEGGDPLQGSDSDDIIINFNGSQVDGGNGNDLIINFSDQASIYGGAGNDKVVIANSLASNLNVDLGEGDDSFIMADMQNASSITIQGGSGNDNIQIGSVRGASTALNIDGGAGNDKISMNRAVVGSANINANDGNDKINIKDILVNSGQDAIISGGSGNNDISIGFMHGVSLNGAKGNDTINIGYASNSIIDGGEGDNEITIGTMFRSLLVNSDGSDVISIDSMLSSMIASKETIDSLLFLDENEADDTSLSCESKAENELNA